MTLGLNWTISMPAPAPALRFSDANILCRRETTRPETARTTIRSNGIHACFSARPTGIALTRTPSAYRLVVSRPSTRLQHPVSSLLFPPVRGDRIGRRQVRCNVIRWTVRVGDKPMEDRKRGSGPEPPRGFPLRRQRFQQCFQAFPPHSLPFVEQFQTVTGDTDEGSTPIAGIGEPGHQALPFLSLDQLSHRRLADPFLRGQRRKPDGPFTAHPVQRVGCGRAQIGAVGEISPRQVHCLVEKLTETVVDLFIGPRLLHTVSLSCSLFSGNPD